MRSTVAHARTAREAHSDLMTRLEDAMAMLQEEIQEHKDLALEAITYSEVTLLGVLVKQIEALYK